MTEAEGSVLLVEDDAMVRSWVRLALRDSAFRLAGEAESAAAATQLLERRRPDILLVDYRLPDQVGTELIRELRRGPGDAGRRDDGEPPARLQRGGTRCWRAGQHAQDGKPGRAPRDSTRGARRSVLLRSASSTARRGQAALSPREREVLRLIAGGATNRQVAAQLAVGDETVKTLLARTFAKLGVSRRAEAISRGHELGLL